MEPGARSDNQRSPGSAQRPAPPSKRSLSKRVDLVIFRLSCCCGLRRAEISGLRISDVVVGCPRPHIKVRRDNTKGREGKRRERYVPLFWDAMTLVDIQAWIEWRIANGAGPNDPVVSGVSKPTCGKRLRPDQIAKRWRTSIKSLGKERVRQLSCHTGRRTAASLSLRAGHSLAEVRDMLGHANTSTTSLYLDAYPNEGLPDVFAEVPAASPRA